MTPWEDPQLIEAFDEEFEELAHFAAGSVVDCGFGYLDRNGAVDPSKPVELWITGRMTYVGNSSGRPRNSLPLRRADVRPRERWMVLGPRH